ncbi:MAG TPA: hypothetical protein VM165_00555 [Planctomycetaceae bacterium]|nr:hypothetical protein [Planctomycetaceae bacterium]
MSAWWGLIPAAFAISIHPAAPAISVHPAAPAVSVHPATFPVGIHPAAFAIGVDAVRLGNLPEGFFEELPGLVAILHVLFLHFFRCPERREVMLETAEDRLAVGLVAGGVQNVRVPDVVNVLRGNENRFRVPEHQGQELLVFVQCAGDAFFIPQQFAIAPLGFERIVIEKFAAEVVQVEVRNGFRQRSSGSFKKRHHSPSFMSPGVEGLPL